MKKKILIIILTIVFAGSLIAAKFILPNSKIGSLIGGTSKKTGSNFIKPGANDTHKGIVYLDPTDLEKYCTESDVVKNVNENGTPTGIKKGCMRFYVYDDTGDTYKMILDHNISDNLRYGSYLSGYDKEVRNVQVFDRLNTDTYDWKIETDLITKEEIDKIVGAEDVSTYYLDKPLKIDVYRPKENQIANAENKSKYSWLFDNTYHCISYGCNFEEGDTTTETRGYWTKEGNYTAAVVTYEGKLEWEYVQENSKYGVRPVAIISKSQLPKKDSKKTNSKKINIAYVAPAKNDTHKGIAYLDPTDLEKYCTEEDVKKNVNEYGTPTGIDSGCMKFYVYDDSGDNYKMILDHNVGGAVPESSAPKLTVNNAATQTLEMATEGWVGTPRLLTANEVAHIVGVDEKLQWEQTKPEGTTIGKESDRYFLDGSGTDYSGWSKAVANESNKSKYAWLYDYTNGCIKNGCNIEDNNKYKYNYNSDLMAAYGITERYVGGYWLARANESFLPSNWYVYYGGLVDYTRGLYNDYQNGIRPVIKLSKQEVVLK